MADTDRVLLHAGGRLGRGAGRRRGCSSCRCAEDLGFSRSELSMYLTFYFIATVFAMPVVGKWITKYRNVEPRAKRVVRVRGRCRGGGHGALFRALAVVDIGHRVRPGGQLHLRRAHAHSHRQLVPVAQGPGAGRGHVVLRHWRRRPRAGVHPADPRARMARGLLRGGRRHGAPRAAVDAVRVQAASRGRGRSRTAGPGRTSGTAGPGGNARAGTRGFPACRWPRP